MCINLNRKINASNADTKDNMKGIKISIIVILFSAKTLGDIKKPDIIIVGIDINNDIFIESYLL